nr:LytTR family DNA-binding domain-containing protein [Marivita sp. GX14005]
MRDAVKRELIVDGERIDLTKLLHIEAREHHVQLTFEDAHKLSRARLRDIVAQTQSEDGFQPHRSWWVARDPSITPLRRDGRMYLRLRDDTEVPVARTRIEDVQRWLDTHLEKQRPAQHDEDQRR